jgi:predicted outer membrane protein
MDKPVGKNQNEVEAYRQAIFKSKEECRRVFAKEPFEKKIKTAFQLYRRAEYLKKFRPHHS